MPCPGGFRWIRPEERAMAIACGKPPDGSTRWSVRKPAKVVGLSKSTVHRILNGGELKPCNAGISYWCGKSPDPELQRKQTAILGLCLGPPDNAPVLSVDQKSHIQALDRTQRELSLRPGKPRRQTQICKRRGTTSLLPALVVHHGRRFSFSSVTELSPLLISSCCSDASKAAFLVTVLGLSCYNFSEIV